MSKLKKRFVPQFAETPPVDENFKQLLENINSSHVKEGLVVKGQVISIGKDVIIVDVGLKNECRIPIEEFATQPLPEVGDYIHVFVVNTESRGVGVVLSRTKAIHEKTWIELEAAHAEGTFVTGAIFGRVKGGFTVDISGIICFLPGSQVDVRPIRDMTPLMGVHQPFQIIKMDRRLGNIVVSRRAVVEDSRSEARDEMLSKIKEGMTVEGIVKNITDYGAFIDLGSVDGLLHVTDISWRRINHPSEVLTIGQKIKVMIIKFNEETKRISLGMKQLDNNPWQGIQNEFPVGKEMVGKISNIADYGVFIELKDGIEGLVHSSEISWIKSNQNPKKSLSIGQEVKFLILEVDTEKHRISLSIKQCTDNPLIKFSETHPVGSVITAPVRNITDFGMFVALDGNVDGMIHETDISWEGNGGELLKSYKKGDEVECKVLSIDVEKERVSLGIKQLIEEPTNENTQEFKKNSIATCVVTEVTNEGVAVSLNDIVSGFIKKVDLSSEKTEQKSERFAVGDRIDAKIISVEKNGRKVALSIKALELDERKKVIKEYGSTDSGASLGDILGAALGQNSKRK